MEEKIEFYSENGINVIKIEDIKNYNVEKTFDCGQCFRFSRVDNSPYDSEYSGVAFSKFVSVAKKGNDLYIFNISKDEYEKTFKHFLALDEDYDKINAELLSNSDSEIFGKALEEGSGIRILHQDSWECVCSFIISQNNNIPRIKKIIHALSESAGTKVDTKGMEIHGATNDEYSFPSANAIAERGEKYLVDLKTGFRAKYINDASIKWGKEIIYDDVIKIEKLDDAIAYLSKVKGIGQKVASCALLFGFDRYDPFPVDVWMKRVLEKYFDKDFDPKSFGKYAGIAQQYLFDYERRHTIGN